ncbi:MAG: hypothetical protein IJ150_03680 [Bacteroidales bacterium]|nr:hypothetical protein [Bacteroidales bacterium]
MKRKIKRANEIWYRVTEPEELFFYALYKFNAYWAVGSVERSAANKVHRALNIKLHNYKIELSTDHLKHFLYSHFDEKRIDQRDVCFDDIKEIGNIINLFSSVDFGNKQDTLIFRRKKPDGIFELVVTIDEDKKILSGKSFRIKNQSCRMS